MGLWFTREFRIVETNACCTPLCGNAILVITGGGVGCGRVLLVVVNVLPLSKDASMVDLLALEGTALSRLLEVVCVPLAGFGERTITSSTDLKAGVPDGPGDLRMP